MYSISRIVTRIHVQHITCINPSCLERKNIALLLGMVLNVSGAAHSYSLQRACDYASYTPESLGGFGSEGLGLWTDDRSLSASAFYSSLMHIQEVLTTSGRIKEALPILAILEHVRYLPD